MTDDMSSPVQHDLPQWNVFLISGAQCACADGGAPQDLLVANGVIAARGPQGGLNGFPELPADVPVVRAEGLILFPSLMDAHVHLREPGYEYKEDIASGLTAAAFGGFGAVMAMANTRPVNDCAAVTRFMRERAAASHPHGPRLLPVGALTIGLAGTELAPMGELAEAGCAAFSNDGRPVTNTEIFRRGMEYASQWGKIVIDHCEDEFLAKGAHMNEGDVSGRIGVKGQSTVAEALHVARDILLAEYLDLPVHLAHISCAQSVRLIADARARGLKVTAETCPHYLILDDSMLEGYSSAAKVNPPLRAREDVLALRQALREGVFDMLVTDHAPHAAHEKEHPLDEAPNGLIGLETALPLTYDLVRQGVLGLADLTRLWHEGPCRVFGRPAMRLAPGEPADIALFDPEAAWQVNRENLRSKSLNTPFLGHTLRGRVTAHWMGGRPLLAVPDLLRNSA